MLNELLKEELEEIQQEYKGFRIDSLESANWAFRKLQAMHQQKAEFVTLANKEHARIQNWVDNEFGKLDNQVEFFNGLLTEYALEQRHSDPKWKCSTPFGKVSFRKQQPKWNVEDEILLHNLKASGLNNLIRIKEEINKAELKKVAAVIRGKVLIDGEILEGVTVEEQPEAIKIEVAE
jgi:phage host-nuclease inhibitor protein Gam